MISAFIISYALNQPTTIAYEQPPILEASSSESPTEITLLSPTSPQLLNQTGTSPNIIAVVEVVELDENEAQDNFNIEVEEVIEEPEEPELIEMEDQESSEPRSVPFYSQLTDISLPGWQKIGCGIASLAMIIDHHGPAEDVDALLNQGINTGAYIKGAGWSHRGLINLAKSYHLTGEAIGLADYSMEEAFSKLTSSVETGPVMVSVHYTFEPTNPIPHLAVITDITNDRVYYNDPADERGGYSISIKKFQNAWKKRFISFEPAN